MTQPASQPDALVFATGVRRPALSNQPQLSQGQILDATAACLREQGYDGTTIRRIAGRLGCAVGSIYRYCDDKRTLLSIVTQRRFETVIAAIDDHRPLAQSVRLYASVAAEEPQQYRLMFWLASFEPAAEGGTRPVAGVPAVVARVIEGWSRQIGDPRAAQRLWAHIHGGLALGLSTESLLSDLAASFPQLGLDAAQQDAAPADGAFAQPAGANGQPHEDGVAYAGQRAERDDLNML